ncbi:hypothetical protein [Cobetia sp. L2A1]|uniref:hypothetical protein n=1 Tax=Cobetia sp. L2A1 TaxID=2686360 RepID=UPI00131EC05F|nr:hypothetical protein [Cobetia sp. L2A1]
MSDMYALTGKPSHRMASKRISTMPLRSLRDHLFKQRHVEVLVIKQIDGELVHVCGAGVLEGAGSVSHMRRELVRDNHAFAVRMHDGNQILQPHDFNRLVLLEDITLSPAGCRPREAVSLEVNGHRYRVAHTPMRCWHFKGHLVLERTPQGMLLSTEDMTMIRAKAHRQPGVCITPSSSERVHKAPSWRGIATSKSHDGMRGVNSQVPQRQGRELELEPKY